MTTGFDCSEVRGWFPALRGGLVFLDSAASTLKPERVVSIMSRFAVEGYANVHRGLYRLSLEASRLYEEAHDVVARFVGARGREEIVFTAGSTSALHLAVLLAEYNGLVGRGDEIIVSVAEHHSNLVPWYRLARRVGARLRLVPVDGEGRPRWDMVDELLTDRTRIVAIGHVSNVTGYEAPVAEVARRAHKVGALVVVDGAQSVPHIPVDVERLGADMIAWSGHKMLGPTGIGVLWIRRELAHELEPPLGGGGTVRRVRALEGGLDVEWEEPPWRFEAGTPPIIEAVGLAEAARILMELGMENVARHEAGLVEMLLDGLEEVPGARILGPRNPAERRGIVSFNIDGIDPDLVGAHLNRRGIAVRTGLHCAHPLHDALGHPMGSVRASLYVYNCPSDIERLIDALRELAK